METFTQPKITGYRQLSEEDAVLMNEIKDKANEVGDLCVKLAALAGADARWVSIGKTDLQKGFMALVRAVAKPESF